MENFKKQIPIHRQQGTTDALQKHHRVLLNSLGETLRVLYAAQAEAHKEAEKRLTTKTESLL
jgi:hypothetical protein